MALTEFQRAMGEKYNPRSFQTRRNLFPTADEKALQQELDRQRNNDVHASLRAVIQQQMNGEKSEEEVITAPSKSKPNKKGKKGQGKKVTKKRR